VIAFLRKSAESSALVAIPRWLSQLERQSDSGTAQFDWSDTRIVLPEGVSAQWKDVLSQKLLPTQTHESGPGLSLNEVFADFPVAILHSSAEN
jgi:maltooligosyltrehalose synthase